MAELITIKEAVEAGYGARSTLNLWMAKGRVTRHRVGAAVRLDRGELQAASGRRGSEIAPVTLRRESVAEWAQRQALAAPPLGMRALEVVGAVMAEAREQRAADVVEMARAA